jgi:hypothetical protein
VSGLPKVGSGFWADASSGKRRLRLFSSVTELGEVGAVFDLDAKGWLAREWADSLDDGKLRAEKIATGILGSLPAIEWKNSPS